MSKLVNIPSYCDIPDDVSIILRSHLHSNVNQYLGEDSRASILCLIVLEGIRCGTDDASYELLFSLSLFSLPPSSLL